MRVSLVFLALGSAVLAAPNDFSFHIQDSSRHELAYDSTAAVGDWTETQKGVISKGWDIIKSVGQAVVPHHAPSYDQEDNDDEDYGFPPHHKEEKTVYETLAGNEHFSRLVKILDFEGKVKVLLDDPDLGLTFFAPNNKALTPPRRRRPHKDIAEFLETLEPADRLGALINLLEDHENGLLDDDDDDDKKEKFKKFLKFIAHQVLSYHILPFSLTSAQLAENSTYPTTLAATNGSFGDQDRRIKVQSVGLLKKRLVINLFTSVVWPNVKATNGLIHVVNHPLFPPPDIFRTVFFWPHLSILSSAIQKVGLADSIDYHYVPKKDKKGKFEGDGPALTFFAPTNKAFVRLPIRLRAFLFSAWGERALKKLLEFHIVPGLLIHSDWIYNVTAESEITIPAIEDSELPDDDAAEYEALVSPCLMHSYQESGVSASPRGPPKLPDLPKRPHVPKPAPPSPPPPGEPPHEPPHKPHPPKLPKRPPHHPPPHHRLPKPKPVYNFTMTVPTLLTNHSLPIKLAKAEFKIPFPPKHHTTMYFTGVFANFQGPVKLKDGPASNGVVHTVDRLLNPFRHRHHKRPKKPEEGREDNVMMIGEEEDSDEWEDWEEWLPAWAMEA